ncbi:outer membrane lipoprotein-sorting protein [Corallococcus sp. M34]|uniref:outer membrane lipoprotein-sorting protein n=1 Tax=Citreicoccus inhibens TaxID=2849499 RepID=UPI001C24E81A|nr:outer membrane lipoprotein-sorting protein [Citreicoccus inhibens]MBU8895016.1 outer membrane lipoprotein-sorting protein [Citreicoccus inhibens]
MSLSKLLSAAVVAAALLSARAASALDTPAMTKMLQVIDDRQRNGGDYKALVYLEQKEKDKTDVAREAWVYRRDADDKLMILFSKPKGEAGKGYLRLDKNLWSYDPNVGKWERRTERERIAGTDSRRADFDESRLAEEFEPSDKGEETLGKYKVHHLILKAKANIDVAYPLVELWIDVESGNILKRQEFALSGRLMRTLYYPTWRKLFSESKNADVWFPDQIRIYDEVEKANSTVIAIKSVDLHSLEANLFTKAWLESKSR